MYQINNLIFSTVANRNSWGEIYLKDLYLYYSRRWNCKPNSGFCAFLDAEYAKHNNEKILRKIDISENYLGKNGLYPVLDLVKNCKTVVELDLSNSGLEHEQLEYLVYCLALHPSITKLSLCNNCLHENSIDHILKLINLNQRILELNLQGNGFLPPSLSLVSECLDQNRKTRAQIELEEEENAKHRTTLASRPFFEAEVFGELTPDTSGGYIHYSTWRKNPQYRICVSRTSRISIFLHSTDNVQARQMGFIVMRCNEVRRVIELEPDTIVMESPVDATHCAAELVLESSHSYVVMPFSFRPGRSMCYTLRCTMINDAPSLEEGWVTLELIDKQEDWHKQAIDASWPTKGGCRSLHTWHYNNMYRLRYDETISPCFQSSIVEVHLVLTKSVDPDYNDEKEIGMDVVSQSSAGPDRPPLFCTPQVRRCGATHERKTSVSFSFSLPLVELDVYVIPSTKVSGQKGCYTLDIFCSVPFTCSASHFPHGWNYRLVEGSWNDMCSGGLRGLYQSWKNNPSVKVQLIAPSQVQHDNGAGTTFIACLEALGDKSTKGVVVAEGLLAALSLKEQGTNIGLPANEKELKHATEAAIFRQQHATDAMKVSLAIVDTAGPHYNNLLSTKPSCTEAHLTFIDDKGIPFYLVAMTRNAGETGDFRLHCFCEYSFILDDLRLLAEREREDQLCEYERERQQRHAQQQGAFRDQRDLLSENVAARQKSDKILADYGKTGKLYVDQDFPRGSSSLWLDPEAPPSRGFPDGFSWVRASDIVEDAEYLCEGCLSPPFPHGARHWFASVIHAVAPKSNWIARFFVMYNKSAGFAQFRFFNLNEWVNVLVDDYLPVDAAGALCFGHSVNKSDIFYPLAEKAYAKFHRCYQALEPHVTPGLTLKELIIQGLSDVSGGYCQLYRLGRGIGSEPLSTDEKDGLWSLLKNCTNKDLLLCLMLDSLINKATERQHVGILPDHLYTVTDARYIEKHRLVKVRNWFDEESTRWRGKWGPHSPLWTDTLLQALEYKHGLNEIWMSFDEALFYFTDLFHVELHSSVCSASGIVLDSRVSKRSSGGVEATTQQHSTQFAVEISNPLAGYHTLDIIAGVHQQDARLTMIRMRNAKAEYKNAIGLAALRTQDSGQFIKKFHDDQVLSLCPPARSRDVFIKISLDASAIMEQNRHISLIVLQDRENTRDVPYCVSVRSSQARVSITPIRQDKAVCIEGEWTTVTAGGPPEARTWRDNPQFFLYPSEMMELTISLTLVSSGVTHEKNAPGLQARAIGFTVHHPRNCCSFLRFEPETVVFNVVAEAKPCVWGTVIVSGMKERHGMPYVLVPYCSPAAMGGRFILEVLSNRKVLLMPIDPRLDWVRCVHRVHINASDGNAGGSLDFPSWRWSPQLILDFPVSQEGRLFITAVNCDSHDMKNEIGMVLLYGDLSIDNGYRRRLHLSTTDVLIKSKEAIGCVELDVELDLHKRPGPLVLVVYTVIPYREVDIEVKFYSQPKLEVSIAREWMSTKLLEGRWELGKTAGGSRKKFASWINNPFIGLSLIRPTNIVAILVHYARYSEPPIVKRNGKKKAFLPPLVMKPDRRTFVELDLVHYDKNLTSICSVGPSNNAEVVLATRLEPCGHRPYILVPATSTMEENNDFKLVVFADESIDLFPIETKRLHYL